MKSHLRLCSLKILHRVLVSSTQLRLSLGKLKVKVFWANSGKHSLAAAMTGLLLWVHLTNTKWERLFTRTLKKSLSLAFTAGMICLFSPQETSISREVESIHTTVMMKRPWIQWLTAAMKSIKSRSCLVIQVPPMIHEEQWPEIPQFQPLHQSHNRLFIPSMTISSRKPTPSRDKLSIS